MHVHNLDDLAGRLVNLALAAILVLRLFLLGGCMLGSLIAVRSHHRLKSLVRLERIQNELLLGLLLLLVDQRSALTPRNLLIACSQNPKAQYGHNTLSKMSKSR